MCNISDSQQSYYPLVINPVLTTVSPRVITHNYSLNEHQHVYFAVYLPTKAPCICFSSYVKDNLIYTALASV